MKKGKEKHNLKSSVVERKQGVPAREVKGGIFSCFFKDRLNYKLYRKVYYIYSKNQTK